MIAWLISILSNNTDGVILACGLFGFIGADPEDYFSWDKFNILGIMNDSRGGDACGRMFGNNIEHGVDKLKKYQDFITEIKNPTEINYTTVLGHCRKASVGGRDSIYAQPIFLRKKDINMKAIRDTILKKNIKSLPDETIVFSGIHNGTIGNYKLLATKYGIPTEDHNDSKVIITALCYGNYEILKEYEGTAALVWHNHITNKTYVFKGESKYYDTSKTISEERPLHFLQVAPGNIYISSEMEPLLMINGEIKDTFDFDPNYIHIFKEGNYHSKEKYDRSNSIQSTFNTPAYSASSRNDYYHRDLYSAYYGDIARLDSKNKKNNTKFHDAIPLAGSYTDVRAFNILTEPYRLQAEKTPLNYSTYLKKVVCNKGRYWLNGGLMHGIYALNQYGVPTSVQSMHSMVPKLYYFIEGIMVDNVRAYEFCREAHESFVKLLNADPINIVDKEQKFIESIAKYSKAPVCSLLNMTDEQDVGWYGFQNSLFSYYSGTYSPLFSDRVYTFDKGDLLSIKDNSYGIRKAEHDDQDRIAYEIYLTECRDGYKLRDDMFMMAYNLIYTETFTNPLSPFQSIIYSATDTNKDINLLLAHIHYMRDFRSEVRLNCAKCQFKFNKEHSNCARCSRIIDEGLNLINEVDYGVLDRR